MKPLGALGYGAVAAVVAAACLALCPECSGITAGVGPVQRGTSVIVYRLLIPNMSPNRTLGVHISSYRGTGRCGLGLNSAGKSNTVQRFFSTISHRRAAKVHSSSGAKITSECSRNHEAHEQDTKRTESDEFSCVFMHVLSSFIFVFLVNRCSLPLTRLQQIKNRTIEFANSQ